MAAPTTMSTASTMKSLNPRGTGSFAAGESVGLVISTPSNRTARRWRVWASPSSHSSSLGAGRGDFHGTGSFAAGESVGLVISTPSNRTARRWRVWASPSSHSSSLGAGRGDFHMSAYVKHRMKPVRQNHMLRALVGFKHGFDNHNLESERHPCGQTQGIRPLGEGAYAE